MRKIHTLLLSISVCTGAFAQTAPEPTHTVLISIPDTTIITGITPQGKPTFSKSGINDIFDRYTVSGFAKEYPTSRFWVVRLIYKLNTNDTALCHELKTNYPLFFTDWEIKDEAVPLADYYPNDYSAYWPIRKTSHLDYIKAPTAWGITHGDPNLVIGISDNYLDTNHPDLLYKMDMVGYNSIPAMNPGHGTQVTGTAVAATDNAIGYPAIGFNCKVDFVGIMDNTQMLLLSERNRRVINASWVRSASDTLFLNYTSQIPYQEIYENGTFTCIAAGNTPRLGEYSQPAPWTYTYPASYDYVFSTSGVGHEAERNGTNDFNVQGVHEIWIGDTINTHRHNSRVDILAPSVRLGGLTYVPDTPGIKYLYEGLWGTSFASPLTAGTAALMLSVNPCLTPYQLEYILKKSANSSLLSYPENLKYTGRLGAGALDAGAAVMKAQEHDCNNPSTPTFYIEGIDFNTLCAPGGASNGANPQLTPILKNGTPPYTYRWEYAAGNTATLHSLTAASPIITAAAPDASGNRVASLRLTVYDGSGVQKVASKFFYLKLRTSKGFDLAMRDHYMDMLDEPNSMEIKDPRDWNLWLSPDLWNRQAKDGGNAPQNVAYFETDSNYVYVRVRNVGCSASPATGNAVRLYWSKASTGERWDEDWNGTTKVQDSAGGIIPAGGELTDAAPLPIPALQPGQQVTLVKGWRPPNPRTFAGSPATMDACLLARIEDATHGMTIPELLHTNVTPNVRNNNNIVTRNLLFSDLNPNNQPTATHQVFVANAGVRSQAFDLQLINERSINPHFAGDLSSVAYITLHLGSLYDIWMSGGGRGAYASRDARTRTVIFDGSTTLLLENLNLPAGTKFPVNLEFSLHKEVQVPDYQFTVHLRQLLHGALTPEVYGNVSFQISTSDTGGTGSRPAAMSHAATNNSHFSIFPNPVSDQLTITYQNETEVIANVTVTDITGRTMISRKGQRFDNSALEINTRELAPGVYFLSITNSKGLNQQFKFVKK